MNEPTTKIHDPTPRWWENTQTRLRLLAGLLFICALLLISDAAYEKKSYFEGENLFGFYALYGFFACVILVVAVRFVGRFLVRDEGYYDQDD